MSGVVTAVGGPPLRGRLQMLPRLVARPDEKMMRFPSALHARPSMGLEREVSFCSGPPPDGVRKGEQDLHGRKRSNETHASVPNPDAGSAERVRGRNPNSVSRDTHSWKTETG